MGKRPLKTTDPSEGTLFWVLYWAAISAIEADVLHIITYYRTFRELWPACSAYDRSLLRKSLGALLPDWRSRWADNILVQHHAELIEALLNEGDHGKR